MKIALTILGLLAATAGCKHIQTSDTQFIAQGRSAQCTSGLRRVKEPAYKACIRGASLTPAALANLKRDVSEQFRNWVDAIDGLNGIPLPIQVAFGSCDDAYLQVVLHDEPNFRANAPCGFLHLAASPQGEVLDDAKTIQHELGHAFAGLADTYTEGWWTCIPGQPLSVMCSPEQFGGKLQPDDIAGIREVYRVLYEGQNDEELVGKRFDAVLARFASTVTGCKIEGISRPHYSTGVPEPIIGDGLSINAPLMAKIRVTSLDDPSAAANIEALIDSKFSPEDYIADTLFANMTGQFFKLGCRSQMPEARQIESILERASNYLVDCKLTHIGVPTQKSPVLHDVMTTVLYERGPADTAPSSLPAKGSTILSFIPDLDLEQSAQFVAWSLKNRCASNPSVKTAFPASTPQNFDVTLKPGTTKVFAFSPSTQSAWNIDILSGSDKVRYHLLPAEAILDRALDRHNAGPTTLGRQAWSDSGYGHAKIPANSRGMLMYLTTDSVTETSAKLKSYSQNAVEPPTQVKRPTVGRYESSAFPNCAANVTSANPSGSSFASLQSLTITLIGEGCVPLTSVFGLSDALMKCDGTSCTYSELPPHSLILKPIDARSFNIIRGDKMGVWKMTTV